MHFVHSNLAKNTRQARGVDPLAGMKHAAISWGPGRAVARVPRVTGSGSQRTGQAAFANMTRKGRMFAPLQTWRRWHRKVNLNQKRYAVCSALAASAVVPLVIARGHSIDNVPSIPFVVDDGFNNVDKTSMVQAVLERFGAIQDVNRVRKGKRVRPGKGKARGRRFRNKKGPLLILADTNCKLAKAARNIPGVDVANVNALDIRQLAPGSSLGRFIIWTQGAFTQLNTLFGSVGKPSQDLSAFQLQRSCLSNPDVQRIINSNEVQSVLRNTKGNHIRFSQRQNRNPFRNAAAMERLVPGFGADRAARKADIAARTKKNAQFKAKGVGAFKRLSAKERKVRRDRRKVSKKWLARLK